MKILITHRYYWPDKTSCSKIIHNIAKHLSKKHEVDILTSQPSYEKNKYLLKKPKNEIINKLNIKRLKLSNETNTSFRRITNALILGVWIFIKCFSKKYDVIISTTTPPILNGFFSVIASKITKCKVIYYCMDINPEIGNKVSKDFKNLKLFKALLKIDNWTCSNANLILVHSEDMLTSLRQRESGKKYNIDIINNFSPKINEDSISKEVNLKLKSKRKLRIIFTGNMGRFQGLETVIDAMHLLQSEKDIELIFVGKGVKKKQLIERAKKKKTNIKFFDYQPVRFVKQMIKKSDIGLVTLVPRTYKYSYPSKIPTYLEQSKPIICMLEKKSEIVKKMNFHGYGFNIKYGDKNSLANLLIRLKKNGRWKKKMSLNALSAYNKIFLPKVILNKWSKIIDEIN